MADFWIDCSFCGAPNRVPPSVMCEVCGLELEVADPTVLTPVSGLVEPVSEALPEGAPEGSELVAPEVGAEPVSGLVEPVSEALPEGATEPSEPPRQRELREPRTAPAETAIQHEALHDFAFASTAKKTRRGKLLSIGAAVLAGLIVLGGTGTVLAVNLANTQAAADVAAAKEAEKEPPFQGWQAEPEWSIELDPDATLAMLADLLVVATDAQLELRDAQTGRVKDILEVSNARLWQLGNIIVGLAEGEVFAIDNNANVHRVPADTTLARIRGSALVLERGGGSDVITPTGTLTIPAPTPDAKLLGITDQQAVWTTEGATIQTTSLGGEIQTTVELTAPEGYRIGKWLGTLQNYVAVTWVTSDQTVLTVNDITTGAATANPLPLSPAEAEKPVWAVAVGNQPAILASVQMSATTGATTLLEIELSELHPFGASVLGENTTGQQILIDAEELRTLRIQKLSALGLTGKGTLLAQDGQTVLAFAPEQSPRKETK